MPRKDVPYPAGRGVICAIKEELRALWARAGSCINKINNITPDGDGKFEINAGAGIVVNPDGNGIEISAASVSYTGVDPIVVDNDTLEISAPTAVVQDDLNDYVTINTAQDITATKTLKPTGDNVVLTMQNGDSSGSAPSASKFNVIRYNDTSGTEQGRMDFYHLTTGTKAMRMRVKGQDGTDHSVVLNAQTGGDGFVTAPYRAYNSANTGDVVTIGSLAANPSVIHATGNEAKSGDITLHNLLLLDYANYTGRCLVAKSLNFDISHNASPGSVSWDIYLGRCIDKNGVEIERDYVRKTSTYVLAEKWFTFQKSNGDVIHPSITISFDTSTNIATFTVFGQELARRQY